MNQNSDPVQQNYRNQLETQKYNAAWALERTITAISTGALVLSISLIKDTSSDFDLSLIRGVWFALLGVILLLIIAHGSSGKAFQQALEKFDSGKSKSARDWGKITSILNIFIYAFFSIAMVGLVCFGIRNVPFENKKAFNLSDDYKEIYKETKCTCECLEGGKKEMSDEFKEGVIPNPPPPQKRDKKIHEKNKDDGKLNKGTTKNKANSSQSEQESSSD